MDILALIAAFGGGIIGAYMGALPAFIMTGIYALVGGVLTAAGVGGDVAVNYLAFGSFVGPHIAFAGGVAAAGYAGRKGKLASGTDSDNANYQIVLFQRGDASTYEDYIGQSESDLKSAYGVISPRKVKIQIEGATVTAVRCDIQAYYAVLATVEYDSGDVVYVSGLTKLASISDIVNLVESVSLT